MYFNCYNFLWWMSKWYHLFVVSLKWDSASQIEIVKQRIPQNNIFQQMTLLQYWVYWLILILIQSRHTWYGHIFNIAKRYPFVLLSYLNSDFFFCIAPWIFEHGDKILIYGLRPINQYSYYPSISLYIS